jgi:hypothetical protein
MCARRPGLDYSLAEVSTTFARRDFANWFHDCPRETLIDGYSQYKRYTWRAAFFISAILR